MFAKNPTRRKVAARFVAVLSAAWLTACAPMGLPGTGGGPRVDPGEPVRVAMLLPSGSGQSSDDFLARNLENAARLAAADLQGVEIDLRTYPTGANPQQAASAAAQAVNEGAQIILGPLYAESANAAGVAVAGTGINVLAFSNNPTIAGGNVFVLGPTFRNTANRLARWGLRNGLSSYYVAHSNDLQGNLGQAEIAAAVQGAGGAVVGTKSYPLSQQGILAAAQPIATEARATGADALFLTAGINADLPILATALPEAGLGPDLIRYMGLTRWDAAPQGLALPGLQGGVFAVPDTATQRNFEQRYAAAYGDEPHPLAGLAYDGIAAVGALVSRGGGLGRNDLTTGQGFQGTQGIFRLLPDGTNERGMAVATIRNQQVVILDPAPRSFGGAGF
ncbi:penicillin-binding protein activator [Wenxinia marina]|uniref:Amino acid/amide ABC transporter substrate-binding protein, HAAT family n=1 Tax=Wenxinia marina DSM 24838 TaxID=1123501 RepID=A0A0D0Q8C4_9RHOB|nr:penicillin-binding protein activator [Wenxinia marina]KIQ70649.1 amino acid/amide ABC transporter substrate-binding protein, HAAT family [Wenxinia marina DSM 24838]GGL51502.1 penicillin-binding protein activator [Wenxinia marina]